jgi:ornithine cyclodeaminase/alanine dehydrogenase-like protein (mu-crystallin family)
METLFLREEDVKAVLDFDMAIDAIEEGFRQYGLDLAQSPPWRDLSFAGKNVPHGAGPCIIQAMAYLEKDKIAVIKHFYYYAQRQTSILKLLDIEAGKTLSVMEANYESWMRTGAAGAIGAKYLTRKSSKVMGIIGTGNQARSQVRFVSQVLPIEKLFAYSLDSKEKREAFAREIETEVKIEVVLTASAQAAVENSDILITATRSTQPIIEGAWIKKGLHITCMGADDPMKTELAPSALSKADKIIIDYEKALETAQLRIPLSRGQLKSNDIYGTIGEVVAGKKPGRESDTEVTIFHSTGMTVQDAAIALAIYRKACEKGVGSKFDDAREMIEAAL